MPERLPLGFNSNSSGAMSTKLSAIRSNTCVKASIADWRLSSWVSSAAAMGSFSVSPCTLSQCARAGLKGLMWPPSWFQSIWPKRAYQVAAMETPMELPTLRARL